MIGDGSGRGRKRGGRGGGCSVRTLPGRKQKRQGGLAGRSPCGAYAGGVGFLIEAIAASSENVSSTPIGSDSEGKSSRRSSIASSSA